MIKADLNISVSSLSRLFYIMKQTVKKFFFGKRSLTDLHQTKIVYPVKGDRWLSTAKGFPQAYVSRYEPILGISKKKNEILKPC